MLSFIENGKTYNIEREKLQFTCTSMVCA